jgi:hypothetical protein
VHRVVDVKLAKWLRYLGRVPTLNLIVEFGRGPLALKSDWGKTMAPTNAIG